VKGGAKAKASGYPAKDGRGKPGKWEAGGGTSPPKSGQVQARGRPKSNLVKDCARARPNLVQVRGGRMLDLVWGKPGCTGFV